MNQREATEERQRGEYLGQLYSVHKPRTNVGLGISNLNMINFVDQDIRKPGPEGGQFK